MLDNSRTNRNMTKQSYVSGMETITHSSDRRHRILRYYIIYFVN